MLQVVAALELVIEAANCCVPPFVTLAERGVTETVGLLEPLELPEVLESLELLELLELPESLSL